MISLEGRRPRFSDQHKFENAQRDQAVRYSLPTGIERCFALRVAHRAKIATEVTVSAPISRQCRRSSPLEEVRHTVLLPWRHQVRLLGARSHARCGVCQWLPWCSAEWSPTGYDRASRPRSGYRPRPRASKWPRCGAADDNFLAYGSQLGAGRSGSCGTASLGRSGYRPTTRRARREPGRSRRAAARGRGVDVAVIPQPEVHVIPHRTPECNLVDGDSLRSATGGEETVELSRQVVGRGPTELCGDDDGLVAAA